MEKILLDTNFLMIPAQFKVDIYSEIERIADFKYELYVLDKSITELENIIKERKGRTKEQAKLSLQLLKSKKPKVLKTTSELHVDRIILDLGGYIVATQDLALKRALKAKRVKIITLRQKKYLVIQ
ncbi:PIN domain-containing protein [Nanoarchaeota archaeon]